MASRAFPWKLVLIVSGLLVIGGLIGAYLVAMRGAVQAFYQAEYRIRSSSTVPSTDSRGATQRRWRREKPGQREYMSGSEVG
jgi:hypothetical protein